MKKTKSKDQSESIKQLVALIAIGVIAIWLASCQTTDDDQMSSSGSHDHAGHMH